MNVINHLFSPRWVENFIQPIEQQDDRSWHTEPLVEGQLVETMPGLCIMQVTHKPFAVGTFPAVILPEFNEQGQRLEREGGGVLQPCPLQGDILEQRGLSRTRVAEKDKSLDSTVVRNLQ